MLVDKFDVNGDGSISDTELLEQVSQLFTGVVNVRMLT